MVGQRSRRRHSVLSACLLALAALLTTGPAAHAAAPAASGPGLQQDLCYQIVTDRFFDANPSNNNPAKSPGLFDSARTNWKQYWGGDFAGIQKQLGYLKNMGVTSIWISPHVDNVDVPVVYNGVTNTGYHGYWTRDFSSTEEHFGTLAEFDSLVAAAHANGIKVIMDWAPNHTSPADPKVPTFAANGRLYDGGALIGSYSNDLDGLFHHNGGISNYDDLYQDQFANMADLADLNQQHPTVNALLKDNALYWMDRGVDGIRLDAVKHMTLGWQKSFADTIQAKKNTTLFGEWYLGSLNDPTYHENVTFANTSGISVLDFYLNIAMRETFAGNGSMAALDAAISKTGADYTYPENLVTFLDNHDMSRFLTVNNSRSRLHQALAFMLTVRGTPCVNYGTEQYLHHDTSGGSDPYNRPMMPGFDTTTPAYQEIATLSALRQSNPALAFGTHRQRWISDDVYVYERQFGADVVLVAINKGSSDTSLSGLNTALPAGAHPDYLGGTFGGGTLTVSAGTSGNNPAGPYVLGAGQIAVWSHLASQASTPLIGSVSAHLTRAGNTVTVDGRGFGESGTLLIGTVAATVTSWSNNQIVATVPTGVSPGAAAVTVKTAGLASNNYRITVLSGPQIPVTFTVNNAPATNPGDNIYLVGDVAELGAWKATKEAAIGPLFAPHYPNWFGVASVPACRNVNFKFVKITSAGAVTLESGTNHTMTTPCSGTSAVTVDWQY